MRFTFLFSAMTIALAGCGNEQETGNTSAVDRAVTADDFEGNDVTAIDAATGAAANMAADVEFNAAAEGNDSDARTRESGSTRPRSAPPPSNESATSPAAEQAPQATEPSAESNSAD